MNRLRAAAAAGKEAVGKAAEVSPRPALSNLSRPALSNRSRPAPPLPAGGVAPAKGRRVLTQACRG